MAHHPGAGLPSWLWLLGLFAGWVLYRYAIWSPRHKRPWPRYRVLLWSVGLALSGAALVGPIAARAHADFRAHMAAHLLLGMVAPVCLVLAAPITLLLRSVPAEMARRAVRLLAAPPVRFLTHPIPAAVLDIGGLWILYGTSLYGAMHARPWLGVVVHLHIAAAGYLFTASIIGIDPIRHRPSWALRAGVLIAAAAGHAILAKVVFGHAPDGIPTAQAQAASRLMYYGGDAIELAIVTVFCRQWYRASAPKPGASGVR